MLLRWRATVLSLKARAAAISWLLLPVATSRSTSISRGDSPRGAKALASCGRVAGGGAGAELLERPPGGGELGERRLLVAQRAEGSPEGDSVTGDLVGRADLAPPARRRAKFGERAGGIAFDAQGSARLRCVGLQRRGPEGVGDRREFRRQLPGLVERPARRENSIAAGSRRDRLTGSIVSPSSRLIAATAAAGRLRASQSRARPGCGS